MKLNTKQEKGIAMNLSVVGGKDLAQGDRTGGSEVCKKE